MRALGVVGLLGAALLLGSCAPPDLRPGPDTGPPGRPADGLLDRPDLQRIVDLQQQRDGTALLPYLDHEDATVRARAAFALGSVQDTAAAPRLVELLLDLDPRVRADAAFALGQLPLDGLSTPLFNALKVEWNEEALLTQLEAVGKRCEPAAGRRLFQVVDPRWRAAVDRAMARCVLSGAGGEEMWVRLAEDLTHPDPEVRWWAGYAFARHPDPGTWRVHRPALRIALTGYQTGDRAAVHLLRALGRAQDLFSRGLQRWWLENGARWEIRTAAMEAIGGMDAAMPTDAVIGALDDPSVHVRLLAVQALGQAPPSPSVVELLTNHLELHPDDLAVNGGILEILAMAGIREPVEDWFRRPDLQEEAVLLAAVRSAGALEGQRGVELLGEVARGRSRRAAVNAMRSLESRWGFSRGFEVARPVFFQLFAELARTGFDEVRRPALELLRDSLFVPLGGGELAADLEAAGSEAAPVPTRARRPYRAVDWERLRRLGPEPRLHLETNRGTVVLALRAEEAPLTVDGITLLAEEGRYDGVPFHRVVPNFVVQGGDVTLAGGRDPAPFTLRSEFTRIPYLRGVLGMASAGKDTETSQYFVTHSPQPHLDGGYTAFGWVVDGLEVLDALAPEDHVVRAWVTPGH